MRRTQQNDASNSNQQPHNCVDCLFFIPDKGKDKQNQPVTAC